MSIRSVCYAGTLMWRIRFLVWVMAFTALTWSNCHAVGSFQTKSAFPKVVTAGISAPLPTITLPDVSAKDLVGGCGRGRIRDHQAHGCRGPADLRSGAPTNAAPIGC